MTQNRNWTYSITNHPTILANYNEEITLSDGDLSRLCRFYIIHSPCNGQSLQKRTFSDYGWVGDIRTNGLGKLLDEAIPDGSGPFYLPGKGSKNKLSQLYVQANLLDGPLMDYATERAAIRIGSDGNAYLRLFRHIRNCLAHGRFKYLETADKPNGIFIMEDKDKHSFTARMVLGKTTLLSWAQIVQNGPTG